MSPARPIVSRRLARLLLTLMCGAAAAAPAGCQGPDAFYRHGRDAGAGDDGGDGSGDDRAGGRGGRDGGGGGGAGGGFIGPDALVADDGGGNNPTCGSCKLVVLYACSGPDANQIRAAFKVANRSADPVRLADITFRYWYADIGAVAQEFVCDFAFVTRENITHRFVPVVPPRPGADLYAEIGFTAEAGTLDPFADTGEIRVRISRTDQQTITQTDDYSFDCSKVSFTEWSRVTVYENKVLVGGMEPPERSASLASSRSPL